MVPLYQARVSDLLAGGVVVVSCMKCRHSAAVPVEIIKQRAKPFAFVKSLGGAFRCFQCGGKGAEINAGKALGHDL